MRRGVTGRRRNGGVGRQEVGCGEKLKRGVTGCGEERMSYWELSHAIHPQIPHLPEIPDTPPRNTLPQHPSTTQRSELVNICRLASDDKWRGLGDHAWAVFGGV